MAPKPLTLLAYEFLKRRPGGASLTEIRHAIAKQLGEEPLAIHCVPPSTEVATPRGAQSSSVMVGVDTP